MTRKMVAVVDLGLMKYQQAWQIQQRCAQKKLDDLACRRPIESNNTVFLLEHYPVYTTGIRTSCYTQQEEDKLKALGAEFYRSNRGGLITFHGPGQLVAYPVLNLKDFRLGMRRYISHLEQTVIRMCARFDIMAVTSPHTGVWVENDKIAAIGVHGSRFITTHGTAINCNNDLSWFDQIVPCGIENAGVTSLSQQTQKNVTIHDAKTPFLEAFAEVFKCDIFHTELYSSEVT